MTTELLGAPIQTAETEEAGFDPRIMSHLLKLRFIRKVAPTQEEHVGYELTAEGMQFLADYENIQYNSAESSAQTELSRFSSVKCSPQEAINALYGIGSNKSLLSEASRLVSISLLIPALNEAKNLAVLLKKLTSTVPNLDEVTVVDGRSTDGTADVATALGAMVLFQKGTGKGTALRQAFEKGHRDIVVVMDADGSNRPEEIHRLVGAVADGADIAKGSRFLEGGGSTDLTFIRKLGNKFFISLVNARWSVAYTDICYGFLAFRKEAIEKLAPLLESNHFQIETEICIKAAKLGLRVVEIPSVELKRQHGTSKLSGFRDSFRIMRTIMHELL